MSKRIIIIDHGGWCYKIGFASNSQPYLIPSPKVLRKSYFDHACIQKKITFSRNKHIFSNTPIRDTIINDFKDMEIIWDFLFYEGIKIEPQSDEIFFIDSIFATKTQHDIIQKIFFEKYKFRSVYFANNVKLCFCDFFGLDYGFLVDCAHESTRIVPFYNGNIIHDSIKINHVGGAHISKSIYSSIKIRAGTNSHKVNIEVVEEIKHKYCYIKTKFLHENEDIDIEFKSNKCIINNNLIEIGEEIYNAPEIIFNPSSIGVNEPGVHNLLNESILDIYKKHGIYIENNIILVGGGSCIKGFKNRFIDELTALNIKKFIIYHDEDSNNISWYGAKSFCNSFLFDKLKSKRNEYITKS